jgi:molecular chaperone GrpE
METEKVCEMPSNDPALKSEESGPTTQELTTKISELEAQLKEKDARYLYLYAEFDNFKKRSAKEKTDLIKFGWESVAVELLQTVDNLERALAHIPQTVDANLSNGLQLILNQFLSALQKQGVERIEAIGKAFDPNFHEGVGQKASEQPAGSVCEEMSKGYLLHGRLLRPARVLLSTGPADTKTAVD